MKTSHRKCHSMPTTTLKFSYSSRGCITIHYSLVPLAIRSYHLLNLLPPTLFPAHHQSCFASHYADGKPNSRQNGRFFRTTADSPVATATTNNCRKGNPQENYFSVNTRSCSHRSQTIPQILVIRMQAMSLSNGEEKVEQSHARGRRGKKGKARVRTTGTRGKTQS